MIDTRHTDTGTQTQATTIPEGQNWPRVKSHCCVKGPIWLFWHSVISYHQVLWSIYLGNLKLWSLTSLFISVRSVVLIGYWLTEVPSWLCLPHTFGTSPSVVLTRNHVWWKPPNNTWQIGHDIMFVQRIALWVFGRSEVGDNDQMTRKQFVCFCLIFEANMWIIHTSYVAGNFNFGYHDDKWQSTNTNRDNDKPRIKV